MALDGIADSNDWPAMTFVNTLWGRRGAFKLTFF